MWATRTGRSPATPVRRLVITTEIRVVGCVGKQPGHEQNRNAHEQHRTENRRQPRPAQRTAPELRPRRTHRWPLPQQPSNPHPHPARRLARCRSRRLPLSAGWRRAIRTPGRRTRPPRHGIPLRATAGRPVPAPTDPASSGVSSLPCVSLIGFLVGIARGGDRQRRPSDRRRLADLRSYFPRRDSPRGWREIARIFT